MSESQITSQKTETQTEKVDLPKLIKTKFPKKNPCPKFVKSLRDQVIRNEGVLR